MPTTDYEEYLIKRLKDLDFAAGYITACLEEGEDAFLLGVRDVANAQGAMQVIKEATNLIDQRANKNLSKEADLRLNTANKILNSLGLKLTISNKEAA